MLSSAPPLLTGGFILLTGLTGWLFYRLTGRSRSLAVAGLFWLLLSAGLAFIGFFAVPDAIPPRVAFLMIPMLIGGLFIGFSPLTKLFRRPEMLEGLHYFHGIRIIVESVFLYGLYQAGLVAPELTFSGYNLDIWPGILGPVIGYLVFRQKLLSHRWAIAYNIIGIVVLTNTVAIAVLSAPSPFQLFSPDQPTIAVLYFPFVWLPALVAPLMFWAHFISLKLLFTKSDNPPVVS